MSTLQADLVGARGWEVSERTFRPEIQGLRTVAAFLVAVYHVWFDRVSGGVDIFFVVSGFLITESLVRRAADGQIDLGSYLRRIARRILPSAYLVLLSSALGVLLLTSRVYWVETLQEVAASALYLANVQLGLNAVDYLAQDGPQSPVMHYWALSIQGQFYVIWPLFIIGLVLLAKKVTRVASVPRVLFVGVAVLFVASLGYSMYFTATNQPLAYFSMPARAWEFALGGMLALSLRRLLLPRIAAAVLSLVGLAAIVSLGAVVDVGRLFPGFAALVPTLSAALIIIAGASGVSGAAVGVLSSRPMIYLGGVSYAFFLWHWPVFIFARAHLETDRLSARHGAAVLLVSLVLAIATTRFVEEPWRARSASKARLTGAELWVFIGVPALLIALAGGIWSTQAIDNIDSQLGPDHQGALALEDRQDATPEQLNDPDVPIVPSPGSAGFDRPAPTEEGCHQNQAESEPIMCSYGELGAPVRVALVGGSHSTHWQPAFDLIGQERGWEVINITKSSCLFSTDQFDNETCNEWNRRVVPELDRLRPDLVFMTSTRGMGDSEHVPPGYVSQWLLLDELEIPVVAVRDNPRWSYSVPECVQEADDPHTECVLHRHEMLPHPPPWMEDDDKFPDNVTFIDLTDSFCTESVCPSVVGNVLIYRDKHHISVPYAQSLAPVVDRELQSVAPHLFE